MARCDLHARLRSARVCGSPPPPSSSVCCCVTIGRSRPSLFLVAAATDFLDGRLARRWQVTTKLGSFLDTTADKLLVSTTLLGLVAVNRASAWVAFVIIAREFTILGLRAAVAAGGSHLETSMFGKWKASLQFAAIAVAILRPHVIIDGAYLDQWLMIVVAAITAWSGFEYLRASTAALRS